MAEKTSRINDYKTNAVNSLKEMIGRARDYIFTDFRGLNVEQITDLRKKLREKNAEYRVIKNNYFKIALAELKYPLVGSCLSGPTAVTLVKEDVGPAVKVLLEFQKESPLVLKGGLIDRKFFDVAAMDAVSKLPGKEQLIAMLMSTMNAPLSNLMNVMNGVTSKLVRTLKAVADQKAEQK